MNIQEKSRILIVDDDKIVLMALSKILSTDYTIYTARDGLTAIEMARDKKPDLIVLDIIMPGIDGYETLSILKKEDETWRIPVIIISGLNDTDSEKKGLSMEAADYISKPFVDEIVKLRVKNQIQIVKQFRIIEELSNLDQLTGLANRRYFDQQLAMFWGIAIRDQSPISLLMIDADKFKTYNDTYGHVQGDMALRTIAGVLTQELNRSGDFAARYGGEEFCVILPNTNMNGASILAEKMRKNMEHLVIPCIDGTPTQITLSIGVHSIIPAKTDTVTSFIHNADLALYSAKQSGRNRVCEYTEE